MLLISIADSWDQLNPIVQGSEERLRESFLACADHQFSAAFSY